MISAKLHIAEDRIKRPRNNSIPEYLFYTGFCIFSKKCVVDFDLLLSEVAFKTSRSGGSGGQNVNKVSTKVELSFDISASRNLTEEEKELLSEKLYNRITKDGVLLLTSQSERTQLGNKRVVIEKFKELLRAGFHKPKVRKPKQISKAMKARRLEAKKRRSEVKSLRRKDF